jgi:hypothetical protein
MIKLVVDQKPTVHDWLSRNQTPDTFLFHQFFLNLKITIILYYEWIKIYHNQWWENIMKNKIKNTMYRYSIRKSKDTKYNLEIVIKKMYTNIWIKSEYIKKVKYLLYLTACIILLMFSPIFSYGHVADIMFINTKKKS